MWTDTSISGAGRRLAYAGLAQVTALALLSACVALKSGDALPHEVEGRMRHERADPEREDDAGRRPAADPDDAALGDASRDAAEPTASDAPPSRDAPRAGDAAGPPAFVCPDLTTQSCAPTIWPDSTIRYAFADTATERTQIRAAMERWQRAAAHAIRFVEAPDATAKVTLHGCQQGSRATGYDGCEDGCDVALCAGAIHHELGRVIGLSPQQRRNDRDHYLRVTGSCDDAGRVARCTTQDNASDLGPFDYASSLLPPGPTDWLTRWDGASLCEGAAACRSAAERLPTALDGAAVVERYQLDTGWGKFRRTLPVVQPAPYEPKGLAPLKDDAALPAGLARDASPALETWGWASLAVYVRAESGALYKKYYMTDTMHFSGWESLDQPSGLGDVSDPAIAGWASNHSHLIVRRGTTIHIRSNQSWSAWESLGGPEALAASAPAITSWGEDRLDIVVRAQDDRVYHKSCSEACVGSSGTWSDWVPLDGASVRGKPAIVARAAGKLAVFAHGVDGNLWSISYDAGSWGTWAPVPVQVPLYWDAGCPDCASPAAGARSSDSLDVYVRGRDQLLWTSTWTEPDGFAPFMPRGGVLASSPATISTVTADRRADVVAILEEDQGEAEPHRAIWWKAVRQQ